MSNSIELYTFNIVITAERFYNSDSSWGTYWGYTYDDVPYYNDEVSNSTFDGTNKESKKFCNIVGKMQQLMPQCEYKVEATYEYNKTYGHQYKPVTIYSLIPQSKEKQRMFLRTFTRDSIVDDLLEKYPNLVNDVVNGVVKDIDYSSIKGLGDYTWNKIKESIINNFLISDILIMLKPLGVTYTMIKKLLSSEPNPALLKQEIQKNPYILTKINGLGFKKVDSLALKLYPDMVNKVERLVSFISFYLNEIGDSDGHTWCSKDILINEITNNVPECADKFEWLIENNSFLHIENDHIGLNRHYNVEMKIFDLLSEYNDKSNLNSIEPKIIQKGIALAEKEQGFTYTDEQKKIIISCVNNKVSLITGNAGTGKTSVMRAILKIFTLNTMSIEASALSAMASKRISEATNYQAKTIHRTLGYKGGNKFEFNKDNKLKTDVMFMDEGSMTNASLFLSWLQAINNDTRVIISGDNKQLPPIGYGNVFSDLLEKLDKSNVFKLTKPMRQAEMSGILVDANIIRENKSPLLEGIQPKLIHGELQDMYYMFRDNRQSLFNIAVKTYIKSITTDGMDNVVIIVPRKQGCLNSTEEINNYIQEQLLSDEKLSISNTIQTFKLGARVMQTVNDYNNKVFNGEIGYITKIDKQPNSKGKMESYCVVTFTELNGCKKDIEYFIKDLISLDLAYALTVHKCQGSGYKTVIGIIDNTHFSLLDNCMLYTLLTRAKQRCLLLSEPNAFYKCINTSHNDRNTWLSNKTEDD